MYTFNTWRDPYDEGFNICARKQVTLEEGLTVLVGCNGAGKTTFIYNIQDDLRSNKIPYYDYDSTKDSGSSLIGEAIFHNNIGLAATSMCSSEGENITIGLSKMMYNMNEFLKTGVNPKDKFVRQFFSEDKTKITTNKRFIFMDAVDSGYSIDNVIDLKETINAIIDNSKKLGIELYIIVAANAYELAYDTKCYDIYNAKYVEFPTYESYKKFVLKSRERKNKRYKK